jgi:hyperosmotically inducible periplasmic protein
MHNKISGFVLATAAAALIVGCQPGDQPNVERDVETALSQAGFTEVDVQQDRTTGVVTLTGEVESEADRQRAEQAARTAAGTMIVSNEISVMGEFDDREGFAAEQPMRDDDPWGEDRDLQAQDREFRAEQDAEFALNGDAEIEASFEQMLTEHGHTVEIDFEANDGVLRLSGEVESEQERAELEQMAAAIPNVRQVINELQVSERVVGAAS